MQNTILKNLLTSPDYFGKVYPHLNKLHFNTMETSAIFSSLQNYFSKYETAPNIKELGMFIKNSPEISEAMLPKIINEYKEIMTEPSVENPEFLIDETEKYIQKVELSEAIFKSADLIEKNLPFEGVIGMVEKALSVTFDNDIGMDYGSSSNDRFDYYTRKIQGSACGIKSIDRALGSGYRTKTLNLRVAPSHGGKSSLLINDTANFILNKEDTLFVSLEMIEEEIARRIDANLLNHPANDLGQLGREEYNRRLDEINKDAGKLIIKEYPAGTFNTIKLKSLLSDLAADGFHPKHVVIDYIGLMNSSRSTLAQAGGMYQFYKLVAEELHGFSKKYDICMHTASQLNRGSYDNLEAGLDSIADSLGVIQTADVVLAILSNPQLREENKSLLKFLKNRNTGQLSSHLVESHFETMRFLDYDEEASTLESVNSHVNSTLLQSAVNQNTTDKSVLDFN